jgi:hypothetical protein
VVLWFGVALSAVGSVYLAIAVNPLSSILSIPTLLSYLFLYTPLKRKTPLCILVGTFSYAESCRDAVSHLVVMEAHLPSTTVFDSIRSDPRDWHFALQACW